MLWGAMNNPARDPLMEIKGIAQMGFDFVDLTLEPPCAEPGKIDLLCLKETLQQCALNVVVHSAYYLPFGSPYARIRKAAIEEFRVILEAAGFLAAPLCNLHLSSPTGLFSCREIADYYIEILQELIPYAAEHQTQIILEHLPKPDQLYTMARILEVVPEVGFHYDAAHAFVEGRMPYVMDYLNQFGHRLAHVHFSENDGTADQHLSLNHFPRPPIDWKKILSKLEALGYQQTITLEVFSGGNRALEQSLAWIKQLWEEVQSAGHETDAKESTS